MFLLTLNDDLTDASNLTAGKDEYSIKQALELPNHSVVIVGGKDYTNPYATLIHYSPDLQQVRDYIFKPKRASYWIDDAIATGITGEIVIMRRVDQASNSKNVFTVIKVQ